MVSTSWIGYIISAIPGIVSLYLYWKKIKSEQPKITMKIVKSSYKIEKNYKQKNLKLVTKILFENKGNASGSVTDLLAFIRYSERAIKMYPFIYGMIDRLAVSIRPSNYDEIFPIEINAYGSKIIDAEFKFDNIFPEFLDRCFVSIDLKNPKKWEWKDLPILFKFIAKTTTTKIEQDACIFREDLPESKEINGTIDVLEEFDVLREFEPKIKFD